MGDRKGYLLTVLGALVGGTIPAYAVHAGTGALVDDGNVALGLLGFAMAVLVGWIAAPLGVWIALSLGKQPDAGKTAVLLIGVLPFSWIVLMPVMALAPPTLSELGLTILSWSLSMLAPLAARWLATWRRLFPSSQ